jgi:hypothetical protein
LLLLRSNGSYRCWALLCSIFDLSSIYFYFWCSYDWAIVIIRLCLPSYLCAFLFISNVVFSESYLKLFRVRKLVWNFGQIKNYFRSWAKCAGQTTLRLLCGKYQLHKHVSIVLPLRMSQVYSYNFSCGRRTLSSFHSRQ